MRLGTISLLLQQLRKGGYIAFFVTERKRSEEGLVEVVQEAYVNGADDKYANRIPESYAMKKKPRFFKRGDGGAILI
jgi:putative transposase